MWLVKYFLFFSSAIVSVLGAGAVIAGFILFYSLNHFLPVEIASLLTQALELLKYLPYQLLAIGAVVCLSTFLGACGAVLSGNVGKWLLIIYTIELTIFVALNIFILGVLHKGHQKNSGAEASPLIMIPPEPVLPAGLSSIRLPGDLIDHKLEKPALRRRRGALSNIVGSIGNTVSSTANFVGDQVSSGANFVGDKVSSGVNFVGDKVSSGANFVGDKISSGAAFAGDAANALTGAVKLANNLINLAVDAGKLVLSLFQELTKEEEDTVKWIRPILGMYTQPVFRLTDSKFVMSTWAIAIGVEVFFILLNIYLCTTKNQLYEETYYIS